MPRLLHVLDRRADFETRRAVESLTRGLGDGFEVRARTIGAGGDFANAASAALGLRREAGGVDVVHAWGLGALSAVALGPFRGIVFSPTGFPSPRGAGWVRTAVKRRDVHVVCPTETQRRALQKQCVPDGNNHLIRPGIEFGRLQRGRNPELRAALGFREGQSVLLAAGESTREADHRQAVWAGAILNVLDRRTRVLLWGRGAMAASAARFGEKLHQAELVTLAERRLGRPVEFEELLAVADVLVVSASGPVSTLAIATGMAAGVPIAAAFTRTVGEVLQHARTAVMTQVGVPRLLARRILELREDAGLGRLLAESAIAEARHEFSLDRFLEQYRGVYRQVTGGGVADVASSATVRGNTAGVA